MRLRISGLLLCAAFIVAGQNAPSDAPKRHEQIITSARQEYQIRMGGSVDAVNTRDPIVYAAWKQGFQPMRSVKIENTGDTDVVNPWILVNGKRNWRTTKDIAEEAIRTYGDPRSISEGDKARAIWEFLRRNRFHATTGDYEVRDPVKMFNVYGFSLCGDNAMVLLDLWRAAGIKGRRGFPIGHCVVEAWYDGGWHLLDADESIIFLDRDNKTISSETAVARDHDLAKRAYGSQDLPALYNYDATRTGDYPSHAGYPMNFVLRPGESLEWRWDNAGKHHYAPYPMLFLLKSTNLHEWGPNAWATLANGKWRYAPLLRKAAGQRGVEARNVRWNANSRQPAAVPQRPGQTASLTWKIEAPYVIVGGRLKAHTRCASAGDCVFLVSHDGKDWQEAARGTGDVDANLDSFFPNESPDAHYSYYVRAELRGSRAGLDSIEVVNDLQMAPLSLPSLELGENTIAYSDATNGSRSVRATFEWVERSDLQPPAAPGGADFPADGARIEGTRPAFAWQPVAGAADYHFELSDDASMRWALSPNFDALTNGAPEFALATDGLLNPGQRYYWRVRAKSAQGVWGPWSKTYSFIPQGPAVPLHVRLEERDPEMVTLVWDPNPMGRKPVKYAVYGSDEKGFSAHDEPYQVDVGNQKERGLFPGKTAVTFPANLLATTEQPWYRLRPRHAFYRVAAIDEAGNRSASSDFVAAPRPYIYTDPEREARIGARYRYEPKTIGSIGDLSYRDFGPGQSYQRAFWDADKPRFSLETEMPRCGNFEPRWLKIDPETGVLSGTPGPEDAGEYQINIKVEINGAVHIQSFPLKVTR